MTKFHVGDVVEARGVEGESRVVGCDGEVTAIDQPLGGHRNWLSTALTLLRRPVRVGDVLLKPLDCVAVTKLDDGGAVSTGFGLPVFRATELPTRHGSNGWSINGLWLDRLSRADGTPIEPPRASASTDAVMVWRDQFGVEHRDVVPTTPVRPTASTATLRGLRERVRAITEEQVMPYRDLKPACRACDWCQAEPAALLVFAMSRGERKFCGTGCHASWCRVFEGQAVPQRASPVAPSIDALTRALFETDPAVLAHVRLNGEVPPMGIACSFDTGAQAAAAHRSAEATAIRRGWARACFGYQPERGWATAAEARATAVLGAMGAAR